MIVIPNAHVENIYEIDEELLGAVYARCGASPAR